MQTLTRKTYNLPADLVAKFEKHVARGKRGAVLGEAMAQWLEEKRRAELRAAIEERKVEKVVESQQKCASNPARQLTVAQKLAAFEEWEREIAARPNHRAKAGLGPLPDDAVDAVRREREDALL